MESLTMDFSKNFQDTDSIKANGIAFEIVKSAKILGLTVRNDLKWNDHLDNVTAKASWQMYLQSNLTALA